MNQAQVAALLGRPLTPNEVTNFKLYLDIAKKSLESFLCFDLCSPEDTQKFDARGGYATLFVSPFTELEEVKLNGDVVTDYSVRQWDKRSGSWYNSLVFEDRLHENDEIEIKGSWGFSSIPSDLQLVIARSFDLITKQNKLDGSVKSKRVEDFQITFDNTVDLDDIFYTQNEVTLNKYSLCSIGNIQQGGGCW